ncbi:MAG: hypothetical protein IPG00_15770 [Saprospiraceae bacterium]|nr:hypothetical protein [Saprospiraceae bacterium]
MRKLFLAIIFSKLAISFLYSQHVLYSDFYTGFHTYSVQDRKGNHIINTDDFIGTNIKVDTINNVYLATKSDEIIIYNLDGNQPKNITAIYTFDHSNYVISPLEKSIYYISENQIFRLSYEGKRDTITKQITNVKLSDLCIDPIKKKLYFNKYLNSSGTLIQSDLNGSNQKIIYFYSNINLDLYGMQLDSKHNRMFYRYWENISKIGVLNLDNKSFEEVLRQEYGSLLEYYYDEINEDLYFVNTRKKNIEKKNLKTDIVYIVKRTYPAEVQYISKFKNQIIWMESWNNNYGEFYIGDINDVDHKELFYNNKTKPIRFDYNPKTKKIIGRTNWNQVVSSDITGENFKLQTDRGISSYTDILFYKDRLFYIDGSKYFIVSSKKDGSDYKVLKHFTGLNVVSAVIDDRTEYIYYVNKYNYSIDRIKINGSGFETFWLSTDRDPILSDIALDKENNQLIVTEKDCKCIFTLSLETKVRKIIKSGTITTFYPEEFVYNSRNKFLYINDFWNKKIYRMKIDGSNFTTLKTNTSGAYIKHYDAVENKMYGILSDNATIVEFDENANKINSLATNFGKKFQLNLQRNQKDIFYFIDLDDWQTQKVYSLDLTNSKFNNVLNSYSNPFADFNDYTIDNATNTYYEYADVSGLLIETKIDLDTTFYYNDWPTYLHGIDIIESTNNEFVAYSDNAILKYSKEGKLLDTLVKAEPASNTIKNFYSATYNKIDNRIYFFDYYTK